jgi:ribA/ribD-fused uncharacterized protein
VSDPGAGQDYGVLQMLVPHYDKDGRMFKVPENVYLSFGFFGEEFSGFKKVNIDGFNRSIDSLNVSSNMNGFELSQVMALGRRDHSSVAELGSGVIQAVPDAIMEEVLPHEIRLSPDELYDRILSKKKWGNILTLTGHRPDKLFGYDISDENYDRIAKELIEYCKKHNIDTIVSGMALGFDQVGAQAALDAGIKLVAAVPFEGQESTWRSKEDKERYNEILARADLVVYVSSSKPRNKSEAARMLNERNEWMIHNGDSVYALYNGDEKGGTANAVRYAENMGKKVHKKNPHPMDTPEEILQEESIERMESHPRYKDALGFALRTFHPDYGSRSTNSKETWDLIYRPLETIIVHGTADPERLRDVLYMGYNGRYSPKELRQALISMTLNDIGEDVVVDSEPKNSPAKIDSFSGEYSFLSNMYDAPVTVDWGTFRNAEAAFQAAKLMYLDEDHFPNTYDEQRALYEPFFTASGKEARRLGRNIKGLDEKLWTSKSADRYIGSERYLIMRMIIGNKFRQNPELADKLIATGDAPLVEGYTWGDTYWGVSNGVGENNLGKILMDVRESLKGLRQAGKI